MFLSSYRLVGLWLAMSMTTTLGFPLGKVESLTNIKKHVEFWPVQVSTFWTKKTFSINILYYKLLISLTNIEVYNILCWYTYCNILLRNKFKNCPIHTQAKNLLLKTVTFLFPRHFWVKLINYLLFLSLIKIKENILD